MNSGTIEPEAFDKSGLVAVEIEPLVRKLSEICEREGLPFACGITYAHEPFRGEMCAKMLTAGGTSESFRHEQVLFALIVLRQGVKAALAIAERRPDAAELLAAKLKLNGKS